MAPATPALQSSQPVPASESQGDRPQGAKPHGPFNQPITLPVPYLCQRDSATGQGLRMCFSSTCAMAAAYLKPGCLAEAGQQDDR
jgi:hypothetical protein